MNKSMHQGHSGLLVVERIIPTEQLIERYPPAAPPWSRAQVFELYRGLDDNPWPRERDLNWLPAEGGLVHLQHFEQVLDYFRTLAKFRRCDLLYLVHEARSPEGVVVPPELVFLGYDFGGYFSEWSDFSTVFHELLFGHYEAMRAFGRVLNRSLLLPSLDDALALAQVRQELKSAGADLETEGEHESYGPVLVFGPARSSEQSWRLEI
jgi:hypothetical protein